MVIFFVYIYILKLKIHIQFVKVIALSHVTSTAYLYISMTCCYTWNGHLNEKCAAAMLHFR